MKEHMSSSQAKADYGVALTMDNQNTSLQYDFARIQRLEVCSQLKDEGDETAQWA